MGAVILRASSLPEPVRGRPPLPWEGGETPSWLLTPWDAAVWVLDVPNPAVRASEKRIAWHTPAEGMRASLGDAGGEALLETCRQYLWTLTVDGLNVDGAKVSTVLTKARKLLPMVGWMLDNGFRAFAAMGEADVVELMAWVARRPGHASGKAINRRTREQFYQVILELHVFHADGLIPDGPGPDPRTLRRDLIARVGDLVGHSAESTPRIPEALARHLLASAIRWVEVMAPYLQSAVDAVEPWSDASPVTREERLRAFLRTNPKPADVDTTLGSVADLGRASRYLLAASMVVIGGFTGFRISEILGLGVDCLRDRRDGPAMVTRVLKTSQMPSGTLTERPVPDIVAKAVAVATRLGTGYRKGNPTLFLFPGQDGKADIGGAATWIERINGYARHVGATGARDGGNDPEWWFTPHQFRRFFALFYVRRHQGSLDALRHHFRHVTEEMVWYYVQDPDTARFLAEERTDFTVEVMSLVSTGTAAAAGLAARRMRELGAAYRARALTPGEVQDAIRRKVGAERIELRPTGYGFCFRSPSTAHQAACGVNSEGMPNAAGRTLDACLGCANGCFSKSDEPALRLEYVSHKEVAEDARAGDLLRNAARLRMKRIADKLAEFDT